MIIYIWFLIIYTYSPILAAIKRVWVPLLGLQSDDSFQLPVPQLVHATKPLVVPGQVHLVHHGDHRGSICMPVHPPVIADSLGLVGSWQHLLH